jgi:hypothetical protein
MPADLVITGGYVIDGTGGPRTRADVAVTNGRIVEISSGLSALPTNGFGDSLEEKFAHQFRLHDAGAFRLTFADPGRGGLPFRR